MEKILFKGRRIDNKEWVEGGYSEHDGRLYIIVWERYIPDIRDWKVVEYYENHFRYRPVFIEVDPKTVCQYTKESIYEEETEFEGRI